MSPANVNREQALSSAARKMTSVSVSWLVELGPIFLEVGRGVLIVEVN